MGAKGRSSHCGHAQPRPARAGGPSSPPGRAPDTTWFPTERHRNDLLRLQGPVTRRPAASSVSFSNRSSSALSQAGRRPGADQAGRSRRAASRQPPRASGAADFQGPREAPSVASSLASAWPASGRHGAAPTAVRRRTRSGRASPARGATRNGHARSRSRRVWCGGLSAARAEVVPQRAPGARQLTAAWNAVSGPGSAAVTNARTIQCERTACVLIIMMMSQSEKQVESIQRTAFSGRERCFHVRIRTLSKLRKGRFPHP